MPSPKPVISIRRPSQTAADPAAVERFVAGDSGSVQAPKRPDVQASGAEPTPAPGLVRRQDGRVRRRMTVYPPPELARELAIKSASDGAEVSDLVARAVSGFLGR